MIVPTSIVCLVNLVIFIIVMRTAVRHRTRRNSAGLSEEESTQGENNRRLLRVGIATFVILGLTWLVSLFGLAFSSEALDITFSVLVALQGLVIFLMKVIAPQSAREAVAERFRTSITGADLLNTLRRKESGTSRAPNEEPEKGARKTSSLLRLVQGSVPAADSPRGSIDRRITNGHLSPPTVDTNDDKS